MHPTDVDPGVTLAGRYRVAELLAESPGDGGVAHTWRAIDEVLSRSVVVHVLAADDPRAPTLLEASRHAATVSDARFIRVLDAMGEDGVAYVVREWVHGRSLATLLADGPLPPRNAGLIVREVAEALASAHTQGLTHQRLDPDCVVVTDAGSIKIVGLATQLALTDDGKGNGDSDRDPARADALGLGRLLYAGLTARWPTGPRSGLEAALRSGDGSLLSPRQCLAGIPKALDEITDRILSDQPRHGTPVESPDQVAAALIEAVGITPPEGVLPVSGPPPSNSALLGSYELTTPVGRRPEARGGYNPNGGSPGTDRTVPVAPGPPRQQPRNRPPSQGGRPPRQPAGPRPGGGGGGYPGGPPRSPGPYRQPSGTRWRRAATLLVGVVLFVGLILLGWQLLRDTFQTNPTANESPSASNQPTETSTPTQTQAAKPYQISAAGDFDPEPKGNGEEHPEEVDLAHDGKADTIWTTMSYKGNPELGGLKDGVGLWFDLGKAQEVGKIDLTLLGEGTDLELMAAPEAAATAPETIDGWTKFAEQSNAGAKASVKAGEPVKTRFVMVWFTKLPPEDGGYRGGVAEIVIRR